VGVLLRVCSAREGTEKQGIALAYGLGLPCFSEELVLIGFGERTTRLCFLEIRINLLPTQIFLKHAGLNHKKTLSKDTISLTWKMKYVIMKTIPVTLPVLLPALFPKGKSPHEAPPEIGHHS
jgi:hypothetical protein